MNFSIEINKEYVYIHGISLLSHSDIKYLTTQFGIMPLHESGNFLRFRTKWGHEHVYCYITTALSLIKTENHCIDINKRGSIKVVFRLLAHEYSKLENYCFEFQNISKNVLMSPAPWIPSAKYMNLPCNYISMILWLVILK